jgi:hypothetical protein
MQKILSAGFRISHGLCENDFLIRSKVHGFCKRLFVHRGPDNGCQTFGSAIEIDILADISGIGVCIQLLLVLSAFCRAGVVRHKDDIEGCFFYKRLFTGESSDVVAVDLAETVVFRLVAIKAIGKDRIDIDFLQKARSGRPFRAG